MFDQRFARDIFLIIIFDQHKAACVCACNIFDQRCLPFSKLLLDITFASALKRNATMFVSYRNALCHVSKRGAALRRMLSNKLWLKHAWCARAGLPEKPKVMVATLSVSHSLVARPPKRLTMVSSHTTPPERAANQNVAAPPRACPHVVKHFRSTIFRSTGTSLICRVGACSSRAKGGVLGISGQPGVWRPRYAWWGRARRGRDTFVDQALSG